MLKRSSDLPRVRHELIRTLRKVRDAAIIASAFFLSLPLYAEEPRSSSGNSDHKSAAGHSIYGEAFNEGPRQQAYLMEGMGNVKFPVTVSDDLVQRFIDQGVSQLYGFWYYEAERSFRQAAALDPECAMSYWGMALANVNNLERSRNFITQAVKLREKCSRREQLYIDAWKKFAEETDKDDKKISKKDRAQQYTRDLETIVLDFPEDIEAKAMLALQLWENDRSDLPIVSNVAINSLLSDVFRANPMHPAHHFRIHLWDKQRSEMAIESAAKAGPSLPGIAHMWHMPGHTYSKLHRYHDAAWQQEASARVDHAHMIRDRVMPDQIHNFAHNNEWLIRNLVKIGRVHDAIDLAKNMQKLPRHPKYNTLEKGSTKYGRERLLLVLSSYRMWPELIELAKTMYLEPTDKPELQVDRLRHLGIAHAFMGDKDQASDIKKELEDRGAAAKSEMEKLELAKKADDKPVKKSDKKSAKEQSSDNEQTNKDDIDQSKLSTADVKKAESNRKRRVEETEKKIKENKELSKKLEQAIAAIDAVNAAVAKDWTTAVKRFDEAGDWDKLLKAEWLAESAEMEKALEIIDKEISGNPGEVLPLAEKCWIQFNSNHVDAAKEPFSQLRTLASRADISTPPLARLTPLAIALGFPEHWPANYEPASDLGERPPLETLGPYRWSAYESATPTVLDVAGKDFSLKSTRGKPTIVFFYLGFGCLHCIEQLHAFSPQASKFREAGIEMLAISSESQESLQNGIKNFEKAIQIPLHADPKLEAFKAFRCYDDFELKPLHGTFLLDARGKVLWQDIGYEPFKDVEFLAAETHRLLELNGFTNSLSLANQ